MNLTRCHQSAGPVDQDEISGVENRGPNGTGTPKNKLMVAPLPGAKRVLKQTTRPLWG